MKNKTRESIKQAGELKYIITHNNLFICNIRTFTLHFYNFMSV